MTSQEFRPVITRICVLDAVDCGKILASVAGRIGRPGDTPEEERVLANLREKLAEKVIEFSAVPLLMAEPIPRGDDACFERQINPKSN